VLSPDGRGRPLFEQEGVAGPSVTGAGTVLAVYFVNSSLKSRATALEDEIWEALP
jgi:hypothetical protein